MELVGESADRRLGGVIGRADARLEAQFRGRLQSREAFECIAVGGIRLEHLLVEFARSRESRLGAQDEGQSVEDVEVLWMALQEGAVSDVSVTFVNYTADGTPFWNKLFIAALRDAQNNIVNYIGVTVKVAGPLPDDPEHGKAVAGMEGSGSVATAAIGGESTQEGGDATGAAPGQQSPGQIPSEP